MTIDRARLRALLAPASLALLPLLAFAALREDVPEDEGLVRADGPVAQWFAAHRSLGLDALGLDLGRITAPLLVAVAAMLVAGVLLLRGAPREAVLLASTTVGAVGATALVKWQTGRLRPTSPVALVPDAEPSFPSGHVLVLAAVVLIALMLLMPRLGTALRVVAGLAGAIVVAAVAVDRLVVGAHWLTDVLASLLLAAAIVLLVRAGDRAWAASRAAVRADADRLRLSLR